MCRRCPRGAGAVARLVVDGRDAVALPRGGRADVTGTRSPPVVASATSWTSKRKSSGFNVVAFVPTVNVSRHENGCAPKTASKAMETSCPGPVTASVPQPQPLPATRPATRPVPGQRRSISPPVRASAEEWSPARASASC